MRLHIFIALFVKHSSSYRVHVNDSLGYHMYASHLITTYMSNIYYIVIVCQPLTRLCVYEA